MQILFCCVLHLPIHTGILRLGMLFLGLPVLFSSYFFRDGQQDREWIISNMFSSLFFHFLDCEYMIYCK